MSASLVLRPSLPVVRALLRVLLAEALRRGRTAEGVEVHPLRQVLFAGSLLGVFCALPLRQQAGGYWIQVLFLYTALYTGLAVLPDPTDAFERKRDILGVLPIPRIDAVLARLAFLSLLLALLVVPLALPSLVWLGLRGDFGPLRLAGLVGAQFALALAVAGSWLYTAYALGRRFGIERVRRVAMLLLTLLVIGSSIVGSSSIWSGRLWPPALGQQVLAALPTSWFAAPLLGGPRRWLEGGAALLLLAAALALAVRTDPTATYAVTRRSGAPRDALVCRLLAALDRSRTAARSGFLPLLLFLSRVWSRDAFSRMRARAFGASLLVVVALAWLLDETPAAIPLMAAVVGFMGVIDGAFDLAMSADSAAVWLLATTPTPAERMLAAMRAAVLAARAPLPALLLALVVTRADGPIAGLAVALAFLGVAYLLVSVLHAIRPRHPFSQQSSTTRGAVAIWLATPLAVVALVLLAPAFLFALLPGHLALGGCAALAIAGYAFGRACTLAARRRFGAISFVG